mmetsp:Transcript_22808/g.52274  ORF Transcript_22808/g.52274 Transcript_22808/m.52274 type:complete len:158 (-) Transcript_22808:170-643(-)|eukprot:CAMPEP_0113299346 /NCGR_PEP_ID=MMETSP0010_2-20120614/1420_1 /TAXON_ID=216773 ORGANISM="Corethron hystrix, Strain 308" /NCGR_SAMPLE_ID=MMETSP0010_2 /ASSEMBLY_ACC=CAM_ASM_000155 /LENGTH=157 /DNA_ID=CAMNT_0000152567 /DNA_START=475 /DNA_END=948 /DNA_ORIENTATION=- /assembly_acc=CAM_ASM_000155
MRFIGKNGCLYPTDPVHACQVDAAVDHVEDVFLGHTVTLYKERFGFNFLNDSPQHVDVVRKELNEVVIPRHLGNIEKGLSDNDSCPWLVGRDEPSIADFVLVPRLVKLRDGTLQGIDADILNSFPKILRLMKAFYSLPPVMEFTAERERRKVAKEKS